jgi:hypothetical protein
MAHNAYHFLLPGLDRPVATRDLFVKLLVSFDQITGFKRSMGTFRQFMSFMSDCNAPIFDAASVVTKSTLEQVDHIEQVHVNHYGIYIQLPHGISHLLYLHTVQNSATSQIMFDFGSELMESLSADTN